MNEDVPLDEQLTPTEIPLMTRPTISMPIFCEAQTIIDPMHLWMSESNLNDKTQSAYHTREPTIIDCFLPSLSERNPEIKAPNHEPPAIEAVMPP